MNIVLTGFMAAGKTAVGRAVAEASKYRFEDTDAIIAEKSGMEINEIFSKYGEEYFRSLERDAIRSVSVLDGAVIATGGGAVLDRRNVDELRKNGVIFNLDPDFSVIEERVARARETRPLMKNESMQEIRQRFEARRPFYDNCDYKIRVINGRTPKSYAMEILKIMEDK